MRDRLHDIAMIALFVAVAEVFLILSIRSVRSICHELSNVRFFEPSGESISWQLLILVTGILVLQLF